jgi:hypothetical protein
MDLIVGTIDILLSIFSAGVSYLGKELVDANR